MSFVTVLSYSAPWLVTCRASCSRVTALPELMKVPEADMTKPLKICFIDFSFLGGLGRTWLWVAFFDAVELAVVCFEIAFRATSVLAATGFLASFLSLGFVAAISTLTKTVLAIGWDRSGQIYLLMLDQCLIM